LIFAYSDLLRVDVSLFLVFFGSVVGALLIGITFHEFSHCLAAFLLGDPTARNLGRLTLNPKAHPRWNRALAYAFPGAQERVLLGRR
jgi:hypothetical protein